MNPLVNQIVGQQPAQLQNPQLMGLMKAWKIAQSSANPTEALLGALSNSKNSAPIIESLKRNNWDGEKAFYECAKEQGIDGNEIVQFLKSMGL